MTKQMTRRGVLAGLLSTASGAVLADPLVRSLRPVARATTTVAATRIEPPATPPKLRATAQEVIEAAGLGGTVGFVLTQVSNGEVVESVDGNVGLLPASVTKSLTSLYALDALGGEYRFVTTANATGPINADGILQGDLILVGGGDPTLNTDHLAEMARSLRDSGLRAITGKLLCWGGALPYAEEIEPSQLDHLGYNPSVSGLNLNFNRVHFEWRRSSGNYQLNMDARTETYRPNVQMAQVRLSTRQAPVFAYEGGDEWTVARSALGDAGSRWLPVRRSALYAGDVFRTLAADVGVRLPAPEEIDELPTTGAELARHESATLRAVLKDMLYYSTNLTAEICGLTATRAKLGTPLGIKASAQEMTKWLDQRFDVTVDFKDHSGLSDATRISASDMVQILTAQGVSDELGPILKSIPMRTADGDRVDDYPTDVDAKTGTLNFVSTLAGYVETAEGQDLAFAIFAADIDRREAAKAVGDEIPEGSIAWNARAKRLQQVLLQRWGLVYRS